MGPAVVSIGVQSDMGESAGSGVFFAPDGYLLSNAHVVGDAESIRVTLTDGRTLTAAVVGTGMKSLYIHLSFHHALYTFSRIMKGCV